MMGQRFNTGGLLNDDDDKLQKLYKGKLNRNTNSYFPMLIPYKRLFQYATNINFELYLN